MNLLISSVLLLVISLCTHMGFAAADPATTTVWSYCGQYEYRNSSAFQRSLDKVLDSLTRNVYLSGFNTSSVVVGGQNSNSRVYGLVQCRGDLSSSDFKLCASTARAKLVQGCYNTSGLIQLEGCFLRYEYHNFYNDYDESGPASVLCNTENSSQPQQFTNTVKDAVLNITNTAANSPKLFAAHAVAAPYNSSQHIYSLAQCWRDMSPINCGSCLTSALSYIFLCQKGALGSQFGSMNCYLRSEVYAFYNASNLPTSPGIFLP